MLVEDLFGGNGMPESAFLLLHLTFIELKEREKENAVEMIVGCEYGHGDGESPVPRPNMVSSSRNMPPQGNYLCCALMLLLLNICAV